jgi:hypothetical protein
LAATTCDSHTWPPASQVIALSPNITSWNVQSRSERLGIDFFRWNIVDFHVKQRLLRASDNSILPVLFERQVLLL